MGMLTVAASKLRRPNSTDAPLTCCHRLRLEWGLWCIGALGLFYCLAIGSRMLYARSVANSIEAVRGEDTVPQNAGSETERSAFTAAQQSGASPLATPEVVGRVEIPAIGMVTPLMSGNDSMSLSEGAGHIPGTAVPGGLGTVGIAGHRDTHFRRLGKVTPGMEVRLVSRAGVYHYRITSSEIVTPEEISVLATGDVPGLALVTCYPFRFIGHAPKRFIVHAELVSAAPDELPAAPKN